MVSHLFRRTREERFAAYEYTGAARGQLCSEHCVTLGVRITNPPAGSVITSARQRLQQGVCQFTGKPAQA
jgi:hypothetical protein